MSWRILPAIAALAAAIARPFKRKAKKALRSYETAPPPEVAAKGAPSLHGIGKASAALRRRRRRRIFHRFSRLLAHKPIGWGAVGDPGKVWRVGLMMFCARWDKRADESTTVRLGRRGQKRAARLVRKREVRIMRKAKRDLAAVDVAQLRRALEASS